MVQILQECRTQDTHFTCHKATIEGKDVCCKGFYDNQPPTNLMRIAQRMRMVKFIEIDNMASAKTKAHHGEDDGMFEPEEG
jgi:predicted ester cyclase